MAFCLTPAWDEWIEIRKSCISTASDRCLTPHGVSGLKYGNGSEVDCLFKSHPAWGEWIEILYLCYIPSTNRLTPHGVSGLKLRDTFTSCCGETSHPAWGEWIEIAGRGSLPD